MFEDMTMAEKLSAIAQIRKLREEEAKLVETAKAEALAKTHEGIEELNALGFQYELTDMAIVAEPIKTRKARSAGPRGPIDHTPKGTCTLCLYATEPAHDRRSHRSQEIKKPFTNDELKKLNFVKVAAPIKQPEPEKPKGTPTFA